VKLEEIKLELTVIAANTSVPRRCAFAFMFVLNKKIKVSVLTSDGLDTVTGVGTNQ